MIRLKNEHDIEGIKKAIKIGEGILSRMEFYIKEGMTPYQIDKKIEYLLHMNGASSIKGYKGFPSVSCISVNEAIIHSIPNKVHLNKGDIIKVDLVVKYKNYYSDQARTYFVGGLPENIDDFRLVYGTQVALDRAKLIAIVGNTVGDISKTIEDTAKEYGLGILKDYCGHGVGFDVHEAPHVPNIVGVDKDVRLVKGLVVAIEPMMVLGKGTYMIAKNGFDVIADGRSAHFEQTVIIE